MMMMVLVLTEEEETKLRGFPRYFILWLYDITGSGGSSRTTNGKMLIGN